MSRLQKKCFVFSGIMHGVLFVILLIGPAFLHHSQNPQTFTPIIELVNVKITDGISRGGGETSVPQASNPPTTVPATPQNQITQPTPQIPENKTELLPAVRKDPAQFSIKPADKPKVEPKVDSKKQIDFDKLITRKVPVETRKNDTKAEEAAKKAAQQRAAQEKAHLLKGLDSAASNIRQGSSSATSVSMAGPGGGGEVFANYRDVVASFYKNKYDAALTSAGDIADGEDSVVVQVTIDKSGRVLSNKIIKRSNNASLNRLVQNVLKGIQSLPPFPDDSTDSQRDFTISFDLKAKKQLG